MFPLENLQMEILYWSVCPRDILRLVARYVAPLPHGPFGPLRADLLARPMTEAQFRAYGEMAKSILEFARLSGQTLKQLLRVSVGMARKEEEEVPMECLAYALFAYHESWDEPAQLYSWLQLGFWNQYQNEVKGIRTKYQEWSKLIVWLDWKLKLPRIPDELHTLLEKAAGTPAGLKNVHVQDSVYLLLMYERTVFEVVDLSQLHFTAMWASPRVFRYVLDRQRTISPKQFCRFLLGRIEVDQLLLEQMIAKLDPTETILSDHYHQLIRIYLTWQPPTLLPFFSIYLKGRPLGRIIYRYLSPQNVTSSPELWLTLYPLLLQQTFHRDSLLAHLRVLSHYPSVWRWLRSSFLAQVQKGAIRTGAGTLSY